jgi:hypothetical protein
LINRVGLERNARDGRTQNSRYPHQRTRAPRD